MKPYNYYIKEFISIFFFCLNIFIFYNIYIIIFLKIILLIILQPLNIIKLNMISLYIENISVFQLTNNIHINKYYLPIIEINIPILYNIYIYIYYIILISTYMIIPIILYYIKNIVRIFLSKKEIFFFEFIIYYIIIFTYMNIIINHLVLSPTFLYFVFQHYYDFNQFEFNIIIQIEQYINIYFTSLYIIYIIYIIHLIKIIFFNIKYDYLYLLLSIFFCPPDLIYQLIIIFLLLIIIQLNIFVYSYSKCAWMDLNHRSLAYQTSALTN